ncbi:hypothetical protein VL04_04595 [Chromobacterium violaceum]|nr:hypothetical protein VK93_15755 [Chromobacterium violaceum]KMN85740.1 hypothetical protein VL02_13865 [Chromobacterium violaceum]KMN91650.1 hypothetical protein VL04_04595 [Chromobacterium violaceum]KMO05828.1 hypothetical protein VL16_01310 [Chromobacterium violaceum]
MALSEDAIRKIGMVLGRDILPGEEGSVESFEGFSEADLNNFRLLESRSGVLAVSYIRYRLAKKEDLDVVVSFLATVVQQGIPIEEWVKPRQGCRLG